MSKPEFFTEDEQAVADRLLAISKNTNRPVTEANEACAAYQSLVTAAATRNGAIDSCDHLKGLRATPENSETSAG